MDAETFDFLRSTVAAESGLPDGWGERLTGDTIGAMRDDATKLRKVLGLGQPEPARTRDDRGRFASGDMNAIIRGTRGTAVVAAVHEPEPIVGRLGAGVGSVTPVPAPEDMNQRIREAAGR